MIKYLKENGFPITLYLKTKKDKDEKEGWEGYKTIVTDRLGVIIDEFAHSELHGRALWVKGFFIGFELTKPDIE